MANVSGACAVGYPSVIVGCQNIDMGMVSYKSLARKERYAFHDGRVVKLTVYLWR